MGSLGMMNPPTMMYSQPVMRPPNPFGSVSSAQVSGAGRRQHPISVFPVVQTDSGICVRVCNQTKLRITLFDLEFLE